MNKNLQKQVKIYAGVASAILASEKMSGQVIYVDVSPDTLIDAQPVNSGIHFYSLDVDNDSIVDFIFNVNNQVNSGTSIPSVLKYVGVIPQNSNQIENIFYFHSSYSGGVSVWK